MGVFLNDFFVELCFLYLEYFVFVIFCIILRNSE